MIKFRTASGRNHSDTVTQRNHGDHPFAPSFSNCFFAFGNKLNNTVGRTNTIAESNKIVVRGYKPRTAWVIAVLLVYALDVCFLQVGQVSSLWTAMLIKIFQFAKALR